MTRATLLIKPVGGICDLRCAYCHYWEDHHRSSRSMHPRVADRIASTWGVREGYVIWQGGEPTLWGLANFQHADAALEQHQHALQTHGGLLSDDWIDWLSSRTDRWHVGVSIDGPPDYHDAKRHDARGHPTHERALHALRRLQEAGVPCSAVATITGPPPEGGWDSWCAYMASLGVPVRILADMRPQPQGHEHFGDLQRFLIHSRRWAPWAAENTSTGLSALALLDTGGCSDCRVAELCDGYAVIDWDGTVYPCDHFVTPDWAAGNLLDRPLRTILDSARRLRTFANRKRERARSEPCASCVALSICHGGCPAQTDNLGGTWCEWMQAIARTRQALSRRA